MKLKKRMWSIRPPLKKLGMSFLSVLMALSTLLSSLAVEPTAALAAAPGTAEGTATVALGALINYGGHDTFARTMTKDGQTHAAFCVEPSKVGQFSGTYPAYSIDPKFGRVDDTRAALWFGYGGPGFDKSMWPKTNWMGQPMRNSDYIVATHILLSDSYASNPWAATSGTNRNFKVWAANKILYANYQDIGLTPPNMSEQEMYSSLAWQIRKRVKEVPDDSVFHCYEIRNSPSLQRIASFTYKPMGYAQLRKASSMPTLTANNRCYSLKGATYGVYSDSALKNKVDTFTTDEQGNSNTIKVKPGTYYVKELSASKGYKLDTQVHTVKVTSGKTATLSVSEVPGNDPSRVIVQKLDAEGNPGPIGATSLAGVEFTLKYFDNTDGNISGSPLRTWVFATNASGYISFKAPFLVSGDELFKSEKGNAVMPLGTYSIQETKAPEGYELSDNSTHVATVTMDGSGKVSWQNLDGWNNKAAVKADGRGVVDRVLRQDLSFIKKSAPDMETMPNTAFLLIAQSDADGDGIHEAHVIVTDKNGKLNTAAFDTAHKDNANDSALSNLTFATDDKGRIVANLDATQIDEARLSNTHGVWFTGRTDHTTTARDNWGSLPYDTYVVQELPTSANAGHKLVTFSVSLTPESEALQDTNEFMGTVDDKANTPIYIATTALGKDTGTHEILAAPGAKLTDAVEYEGVEPQQTYTMEGYVHVRGANGNDEGVLLQDGSVVPANKVTDSMKPVKATKEFKPEISHGKFTMEFTFDATKLKGKTLVVFDKLYQAGKVVATHEDINNDEQTVRVPDAHTTALGKDTATHETLRSQETTITDTVAYTNLTPGTTYTVSGYLHVKGEDGTDEGILLEGGTAVPEDKLTSNMKPVTATKGFTAEKSSGKVTLEFTFDATKLQGTTVVAFEDVKNNNKTIAVHADIKDEDQTVFVPKVSTTALGKETGTHEVLATEKTEITDVMSYEGLTAGQEYKVQGYIHVRDLDGKDAGVLLEDGSVVATDKLTDEMKPVTSSTTFAPKESSGKVSLDFVFDATKLEHTDIVVFEYVTNSDKTIAKHEDISSQDQTIHVPQIGTTAIGKDTQTKETLATEKTTITDVVSYNGLTPGKEYKVTGYVHVKSADGKDEGILLQDGTTVEEDKLTDDMKPVTASKDFKPEKGLGSVSLDFTFDATKLQSREVVVFEDVSRDGKTIAVHADISDEAQTVRVPKIGTTATVDGNKSVVAGKVSVTDTVAYEGLTAGKAYKVTGHMVNNEGKRISDDVTVEFVAEKSTGSIDVKMKDVDATKLAGKSMVAFETVSDADDHVIAKHEDTKDEGQTIEVKPAPKPEVLPDTGNQIPAIAIMVLGVAVLGVGVYRWYKRNKR